MGITGYVSTHFTVHSCILDHLTLPVLPCIQWMNSTMVWAYIFSIFNSVLVLNWQRSPSHNFFQLCRLLQIISLKPSSQNFANSCSLKSVPATASREGRERAKSCTSIWTAKTTKRTDDDLFVIISPRSLLLLKCTYLHLSRRPFLCGFVL